MFFCFILLNMFYNYFITSFSLSSIGCFLYEMIDPSVRVKIIPRSQIIENYQKMLPSVAGNLLIAYPYFVFTEKHLIFDKLIFSWDYAFVNTMLWYLYFVYYFVHSYSYFHSHLIEFYVG